MISFEDRQATEAAYTYAVYRAEVQFRRRMAGLEPPPKRVPQKGYELLLTF